jgi:anti-anti-sigma factor
VSASPSRNAGRARCHNGGMKWPRRPQESPSDYFEVTEQSVDAARHVVAVRGEITLFTAPELKAVLTESLLEHRNRIVVDLRSVSFMDSTALGVLIVAQRHAVRLGGALVLVMADQPRGLYHGFAVVETCDAAVALIGELEQEAIYISAPHGIALPSPGQTPLSPAARSQLPRIFLGHSKADKVEVRGIYRRLVDEGLSPWLDEEDLKPGEDWELAIRRAVADSQYFLVCVSHAAMTKAGYLHKEIRLALDVAERQPEGTVFIIPARLDACVVPTRLSHLHWVDLFHPAGFGRLMNALRGPS